jgi:hypothetical protein
MTNEEFQEVRRLGCLSGFERRADGVDHCRYCGSISVAHAIELLGKPQTSFSGSDWKYGWPHKFYIGSCKFYAEHLKQSSPEELAAYDAVSRKVFGVAWLRNEKGILFRAPSSGGYGWQLAGHIGPDGQPVFADYLGSIDMDAVQRLLSVE